MRWSDLLPEPGIVAALQHAGPRQESGNQNEKRRWSEKFANGCAVSIARQFRHSAVRSKRILPIDLELGTEPLTPLGSGTSKRIDVTVVDAVLGLEIGVSLKGLNFSDASSNNYDKNLTGRLYELGDEVRLVHEHLPHAFMVGMFFLPMESTKDKTERAASSFAHTVTKLRERTGRLDPALSAHAARCDASFVAVYTTGEERAGYQAGLVRFFDVKNAPPRRGRPLVAATQSLAETVDDIVSRAMFKETALWSDPEPDV